MFVPLVNEQLDTFAKSLVVTAAVAELSVITQLVNVAVPFRVIRPELTNAQSTASEPVTNENPAQPEILLPLKLCAAASKLNVPVKFSNEQPYQLPVSTLPSEKSIPKV